VKSGPLTVESDSGNWDTAPPRHQTAPAGGRGDRALPQSRERGGKAVIDVQERATTRYLAGCRWIRWAHGPRRSAFSANEWAGALHAMPTSPTQRHPDVPTSWFLRPSGASPSH